MRYNFTLNDELTLENDTAKVVVNVSGPANGRRPELEARVRKALEEFIPNVDWAYSALSIGTGGYPMYSITASVRIPVAENDNLHKRATDYQTNNPDAGAAITVQQIDTSMPLFRLREGYSKLRDNLLDLANKEAEKLAGNVRIKKISFSEGSLTGMKGNLSNASYAAAAAPIGGGSIGSFEKIYMTADVILTDGADEPESEIVHAYYDAFHE